MTTNSGDRTFGSAASLVFVLFIFQRFAGYEVKILYGLGSF